MDDIYVYRPYKSRSWIRFLMLPIGVPAFILAVYLWPISLSGSVLGVVTGLMCIWIYKELYIASKVVIYLESQGIRVVERENQDDIFVQWEECPYAHYATSYKGHLFMVLSSKQLDGKEKKHLANRSANSSRVHLDDAIVIYLDFLQDSALIRARIERHIKYIEPYPYSE